MNVYDQAARYAAKLDPAGFLAWLLAGVWHLLEFAGWLDTRTLPFPGERERTCDTVAHLRESTPAVGRPPKEWAAVVEFQAKPDRTMLERLVEYVILIRQELRPDGGPQRYEVAAVVLNLTGRRQPDEWQTGLPEPSQAALTFKAEVRTMAEEDGAALLTDIEAGRFSRCLLPWIPLMKGADEPQVLDAWKRIATAKPNSRHRSDYGALALIFAELAKRGPIWKDALKGWNMQESPQVLEWQEEARQEGRKEGREEGREEGRKKGLEEASRARLLEVLEFRFQTIPEELRSRIQTQTDLATLDQWFKLALKADNVEAFQGGL